MTRDNAEMIMSTPFINCEMIDLPTQSKCLVYDMSGQVSLILLFWHRFEISGTIPRLLVILLPRSGWNFLRCRLHWSRETLCRSGNLARDCETPSTCSSPNSTLHFVQQTRSGGPHWWATNAPNSSDWETEGFELGSASPGQRNNWYAQLGFERMLPVFR